MTNIPLKNTNKEKSLLEIINIIYQGRIKIIVSIFVCLVLAYLYNQFSTPVFESTALLKKEVKDNGGQRDELSEFIRLQTSDQLETEMELVKTREVLSRVINDLMLYVELKKMVDPNGNSYELNNYLIEFPDSISTNSQENSITLPVFNNFKLINENADLDLYIKKTGIKNYELWDAEKNRLITNFKAPSTGSINIQSDIYSSDSLDSSQPLAEDKNGFNVKTDFAKFDFNWNDAPIGSEIFFDIKNYHELLINFSKNINVSRVGHTDVFQLDVKSSSPLASKIIADHIIHHFREERMEQQKQTVRYSFHFVDQQLTEVQKKLMDAESNLSKFKGSKQIIDLDQNTQNLLNYQSTLEAERLKTDLLLSNYKDKAAGIKKELESKGYFDQSFLEPSGEFQGNSPFSSLMTRLSDLEMQRLELLQKRTEKHPDVVNLDEQISGLKEKLAGYNQNTLTAYNIIINTLQKKLQKIDNLMAPVKVKMQQMPGQETEMARLVREKDVYEKIFKLLLDKREEMRVAELSQLQDIIIVDQPSLPIKPIQPKKRLNLVMGTLVGGFIGIVAVFLIQLRKSRLIDIDNLEEEFRIPIFAIIPSYNKEILKKIKNSNEEKDQFATLQDDNLGIRESYRVLNTKLLQTNLRDRTILVTSCEENTGKTTVVANLAVTMAMNNKNILIIDCDLRKGELSKMFNLFQNSPGLIDFIEKDDSPTIYNRVLKNINIIPTGGLRENSSTLLSSDKMKMFFEAINTSDYDFIIIDTPPVTRVVDTLALGHFINNAILVVRPDISVKETVIGGIQELNHARIKIRGMVANAAEIQKSLYYRYRYGYGYGYGNSKSGNNGTKDKFEIGKKPSTKINKIFNVGSN